jgi:LDH2 family malate/lactate/ureidoglycolate dehydrogenase
VTVSLSQSTRHRLDDLHRLTASLAAGIGVAPARASALATHLLWFDAAGASTHGIATLPTWLDRIDRKEIDPVAEGRAGRERAGTAIFDARNGLPPLALATAGGIASEKARDVGVGIVRVHNLGESGPSAPVAASLAIGPYFAVMAGPGPSLSLAAPMAGGLPVVYDSRLAGPGSDLGTPNWLAPWSPWISGISDDGGWVVLAISVLAFESLAHFEGRVASSLLDRDPSTGFLEPGPWEVRRREARERGVTIDPGAFGSLKTWADRLGVPWPTSFAD